MLFRQEPKTANSTPTAYGVIYTRHGSLVMAVASKEVILSAGVINTPKLLMMSGIGPSHIVKSIKVFSLFYQIELCQSKKLYTKNLGSSHKRDSISWIKFTISFNSTSRSIYDKYFRLISH